MTGKAWRDREGRCHVRLKGDQVISPHIGESIAWLPRKLEKESAVYRRFCSISSGQIVPQIIGVAREWHNRAVLANTVTFPVNQSIFLH